MHHLPPGHLQGESHEKLEVKNFNSLSQVPVKVQIPLSESDLSWVQQHAIPVRHLANREIAAFVGDQILGLNLASCRVARLVGYDYQSRRCEVTPHYLALLHCLQNT